MLEFILPVEVTPKLNDEEKAFVLEVIRTLAPLFEGLDADPRIKIRAEGNLAIIVFDVEFGELTIGIPGVGTTFISAILAESIKPFDTSIFVENTWNVMQDITESIVKIWLTTLRVAKERAI